MLPWVPCIKEGWWEREAKHQQPFICSWFISAWLLATERLKWTPLKDSVFRVMWGHVKAVCNVAGDSFIFHKFCFLHRNSSFRSHDQICPQIKMCTLKNSWPSVSTPQQKDLRGVGFRVWLCAASLFHLFYLATPTAWALLHFSYGHGNTTAMWTSVTWFWCSRSSVPILPLSLRCRRSQSTGTWMKKSGFHGSAKNIKDFFSWWLPWQPPLEYAAMCISCRMRLTHPNQDGHGMKKMIKQRY